MALRTLEVMLPRDRAPEVQGTLEEYHVLGLWTHELAEDQALVRVLLEAEAAEPILDRLQEHFSDVGSFRVILFPVEATLPRPEPPEEQRAPAEPESTEQETRKSRISREELYQDVQDTAKLTLVYVVMVALSSIVAAAGLLKDSVAVIIGAMVIAPLLGPNIALSLATTLGDLRLAIRALKSNGAGLFLAFGLSAGLGLVLPVDPSIPEIASRTSVRLGDLVLALASGSAGAIAFTTGVSGALVGVMVAVALLPPLVATGLLLGAGHGELALAASLLVVSNVICVNLAGVVTFLAQGIRPATWWEADRASKATRYALILWVALLLILAAVIRFSRS